MFQDPLIILLEKEHKKNLLNALEKIYPHLTFLQVLVVKLLAIGYSYTDIAETLKIQPTNIYKVVDAIPIRLKRLNVDLSELDEILHN